MLQPSKHYCLSKVYLQPRHPTLWAILLYNSQLDIFIRMSNKHNNSNKTKVELLISLPPNPLFLKASNLKIYLILLFSSHPLSTSLNSSISKIYPVSAVHHLSCYCLVQVTSISFLEHINSFLAGLLLAFLTLKTQFTLSVATTFLSRR